MFEKRRHRRLEVNLPVILRYRGRLLPATMLNMSCGGIFLRADDVDIRSDAQVEVIFDLDEEQRDLSLCGLITRTENNQEGATDMGVQLTNVFSLSFKALQEYLGKNMN